VVRGARHFRRCRDDPHRGADDRDLRWCFVTHVYETVFLIKEARVGPGPRRRASSAPAPRPSCRRSSAQGRSATSCSTRSTRLAAAGRDRPAPRAPGAFTEHLADMQPLPARPARQDAWRRSPTSCASWDGLRRADGGCGSAPGSRIRGGRRRHRPPGPGCRRPRSRAWSRTRSSTNQLPLRDRGSGSAPPRSWVGHERKPRPQASGRRPASACATSTSAAGWRPAAAISIDQQGGPVRGRGCRSSRRGAA